MHMAAVWRRWWLVFGGVLIAGVLAYVISASGEKRYSAQASVLLTPAEPVSILRGLQTPPIGDPEREFNTEIALVKLQSVAAHVIAQQHLLLTPAQLLNEVQVTSQGTSNLIGIIGVDSSPKRAAAIANAFAGRYLQVRRALAQQRYNDAAQLASDELARLSPADRRGAQGEVLRKQMHQFELIGALQTGDAQLVDPATLPTSPSSPRPKFAGLVGALAGLLLGALAAIALGAADRRKQSQVGSAGNSRLARAIRLPIPRTPSHNREAPSAIDGEDAAKTGTAWQIQLARGYSAKPAMDEPDDREPEDASPPSRKRTKSAT
jgi:uncharacterized protein involved in exopolysaccharide biosynthesis